MYETSFKWSEIPDSSTRSSLSILRRLIECIISGVEADSQMDQFEVKYLSRTLPTWQLFDQWRLLASRAHSRRDSRSAPRGGPRRGEARGWPRRGARADHWPAASGVASAAAPPRPRAAPPRAALLADLPMSAQAAPNTPIEQAVPHAQGRLPSISFQGRR